MYDDYPDWQVYLNAIKCLYKENPVRLDIAGTVESISEITPEILYSCCDTFYNPANMVMVVCGDFEPEELLKENILQVKSFGYCTLWIIMGNIWKDIIIHDMSRKN